MNTTTTPTPAAAPTDEQRAHDIRTKLAAVREAVVSARKDGITVITPPDYQLVNWILGGNVYHAGPDAWHIRRTEL
jgi:hypothetical protein